MDRFIKYKTLEQLREAAKNGNDMARNIIDKYMEEKPDMEQVSRMLNEYFGTPGDSPLSEEAKQDVAEKVQAVSSDEIEEPLKNFSIAKPEEPLEPKPIDISADLDREMDGLIDDEEIELMGFPEFLGNKAKDGLRAKKDASYFKAFDENGRHEYMERKMGEYAKGFDGKLRDAQRAHDDIASSIDVYDTFVYDMADDGIESDMGKMAEAYDELTKNRSAMSGFARHWDEDDVKSVKLALQSLVDAFGKKNVAMVLNAIRDDNESLLKFNQNKIDHAIDSYGKRMESLLK